MLRREIEKTVIRLLNINTVFYMWSIVDTTVTYSIHAHMQSSKRKGSHRVTYDFNLSFG